MDRQKHDGGQPNRGQRAEHPPDDYEQLVDFFENAAVPMHWVGPDGTILRANQAELDALGYSRDEYVGHHVTKFYADQDVIDDILQRLKAGEQLHDYEARMVREDGSIRYVLINSSVHWKDGEFVNTRCVTRDITERKRLQQELKETVERLERSNKRLQQFAFVASHDLQEPLRMISSYLQLLESQYKDQLDEDAHEYIKYAVESADRLREMIQDLLAYSRIDQHEQDLEPVDCAQVVEQVLSDLQVRIEDTNTQISIESLPTVVSDESQLEQLFQNLIANALKYSEGTPRVEIGAEQHRDKWVFRVADDGIGIEPEMNDQIFEVFTRLHTEDQYPGTGIGLSLCQKIVENHGGEIWVDSTPGDGSTFSFTLPRRMGD